MPPVCHNKACAPCMPGASMCRANGDHWAREGGCTRNLRRTSGFQRYSQRDSLILTAMGWLIATAAPSTSAA